MTTEEIARLRALLEKAAPRPWRLCDHTVIRTQSGSERGTGEAIARVLARSEWGLAAYEANASLIVAAVNALPALLDERERLEKCWRCFSCGEVFTDEGAARDHFDDDPDGPACTDPLRADEKDRLSELRVAREMAAEARRDAEEADHLAGRLHSYESEIGRLFGNVGGVIATTPHQAWLRFEEEQGRAEAAESESARLRAEVAEVLAERDAAVSMGTQLERERDEAEAALRGSQEALQSVVDSENALRAQRDGLREALEMAQSRQQRLESWEARAKELLLMAAYRRGRAEALEEAARVADAEASTFHSSAGSPDARVAAAVRIVAKQIRALAAVDKEGT